MASFISRASAWTVVAMLQRDPGVDRLDHAVPVIEQIERDHRRDHRSSERIEISACPPDHSDSRKVAGPARGLLQRDRSTCASGRRRRRRRSCAATRGSGPATSAWSTRDVARQPLRRTRRAGRPGSARTAASGPRSTSTTAPMMTSVATSRLTPMRSSRVRQRIEQVGERHAGDEGQQDLAQHPQHAARRPAASAPRTSSARV